MNVSANNILVVLLFYTLNDKSYKAKFIVWKTYTNCIAKSLLVQTTKHFAIEIVNSNSNFI